MLDPFPSRASGCMQTTEGGRAIRIQQKVVVGDEHRLLACRANSVPSRGTFDNAHLIVERARNKKKAIGGDWRIGEHFNGLTVGLSLLENLAKQEDYRDRYYARI